MNSIELFLPTIREVIRQCTPRQPIGRVDASSLRADAPLIGAAVVWTHRHAAEAGR
jgi:hypothetical protein